MTSKNPAERPIYDEHGNEFQLIETTKSGRIVRRIYESRDGGVTNYGDPFLATFPLYPAPMEAKVSATVIDLEKQASELRTELAQLRRDRDAMAEADSLLFGTLRNHAAVRDLVDFINGKAQFLAYWQAGEWFIKPMSEALASDPCDSHLRLLSLYGQSNGDLTWRRHQFSDGSGLGSSKAQPALTYDDALAYVQGQILADLEGRRANIASGTSDHMAHYVVHNMEKFNMEVPTYVREAGERAAARQRTDAIETARQEIARFQKVLSDHGVE